MFNTSDIDSFVNELKAGVEQVHKNSIQAVEEYLKLIEQTSQSYVPIDSGALRDSFFVEVKVSKNRITGIAGYDKDNSLAHYAKIMHEGVWPDGFWPNDFNSSEGTIRLNGEPISYKTGKQATPRSHFLDRGILENEPQWNTLLKGILDGL
jgi:hypothetical protein